MQKEKIILCGCEGHARSVIDTIEAAGVYQIAGFTDRNADNDLEYRGYRVLGTDDNLPALYASGIRNACVCVGYLGKGYVRERLYERLKEIGFALPAIVDPTAAIASDAQIGEGTFVGKNAVVNSNASVGKMVILNTASVIEHDCAVGDFCHVAVAAVVCGGSSVGRRAFVGANATIIQCIEVEENVTIGAGSVVKKNLKEGVFINGMEKTHVITRGGYLRFRNRNECGDVFCRGFRQLWGGAVQCA